MKKINRFFSLLMAIMLCMAFVPALAEEDFEYEDGNPPNAPELYLPADPSSGNSWFFTCDDPEVLDVRDFEYYPNDEAAPEKGGKHVFRLDGLEYGVAEVTFVYAPAADAEPVHKVICRVVVDEDWNVMIYEIEYHM